MIFFISVARRTAKLILSTALFVVFSVCAFAQATTPTTPQPPEKFTNAEFSKMQREMSEGGGYFMSDNFTSNETSYLHIVPKLQQLTATGGAYLGVGPEQNFTYIAKLRPRIAFLVDIRRQAVLQHLMYKALFQLSPTRTEFLAHLLSKPIPVETKTETKTESKTAESKDAAKPAPPKLVTPKPDAPIHEIIRFFDQLKVSEAAYAANLAEIKKFIETELQLPLSKEDQTSLDYVYKSFRVDGLDIAFRLDSGWSTYFPTLRELLVQTDLKGQLGNFLAVKDDYDFLRELHRKNLIIPLTGDFGGKKALTAVGDVLRKYGLTVSAFYLSNVEQYLFDGTSFEGFAGNIRKLPLTEKSHFIRAVFNMRYSHPSALPGHLSTTLLQPMQGFLKDYDAGVYRGYYDVIMSRYIAPDKP
ncbi:MAG: hypothetical protein HOP19_18020 [Acidobacteria bacterium]|nr:hypothetical protein [Acidobacteriota bacterium]